MKKPQKKALSTFIACSLLSALFLPAPLYAAEPEDESPVVSFEYCGIASVPDKTGPDGHPYRYLHNDLFYIEYPGTWSFGTSRICPIIFFNHSEVSKTVHDFESFHDDSLIGTENQIDQYIQGGGIDSYIKQVLQITDTSGYQFDTQSKEDTILVYSLKKEGEAVASVIVWTAFGKLSIRDERSDISMDPVRDYGQIMVMPVSDSEDFSSIEAIQAYVDSGKLNGRLQVDNTLLTWTTKQFETEYHTYLLCEGSCDFLNVSVYIPVMPAGKKKWMVSFDAYKNSEITYNAYQIREDIMKTFHVLK